MVRKPAHDEHEPLNVYFFKTERLDLTSYIIL